MTRTDRIQTAIDRLNATQLDDGDYAYLADETDAYYRVTEDDLEALGRMLDDGAPDAYSHWCSGYGEEMGPSTVERWDDAASYQTESECDDDGETVTAYSTVSVLVGTDGAAWYIRTSEETAPGRHDVQDVDGMHEDEGDAREAAVALAAERDEGAAGAQQDDYAETVDPASFVADYYTARPSWVADALDYADDLADEWRALIEATVGDEGKGDTPRIDAAERALRRSLADLVD